MRQSEESQVDAPPGRGGSSMFRRAVDWLFSQRHFRFKLLSGAAAGVLVIFLLAGIFLYVTLRDHQQEVMRSHTMDVIRMSSLVENDIASLEAGHRGFLLTGNQTHVVSFQRRRDLIQRRLDELASLILDSPTQRKRIMKVNEVVEKWLDTVALPEIKVGLAKAGEGISPANENKSGNPVALGNSILDQAREILQSLQDEEQIVLNQRMVAQEWASQSVQVLDFLPKLERAVVEMDKEKRGYLLTGDSGFAEAHRRAVTDFYTYNGYLSILVANAPSQAELLANIRSNVQRWINSSAEPAIEAKRAGKDVSHLATDENGEVLMADIRQTLSTFEKNELGVYEARTDAASRERIIKTAILGALACLAVALLLVSNSYSFVLVRQQLSKLEGVETHIRSIIESILDGMITVDETGMIRSINPAAEKMFGYAINDLLGYKFSKLVPKSYGTEPDAKPVAYSWEAMAKRTGSTILALGRTSKLVSFPIEIS